MKVFILVISLFMQLSYASEVRKINCPQLDMEPNLIEVRLDGTDGNVQNATSAIDGPLIEINCSEGALEFSMNPGTDGFCFVDQERNYLLNMYNHTRAKFVNYKAGLYIACTEVQ